MAGQSQSPTYRECGKRCLLAEKPKEDPRHSNAEDRKKIAKTNIPSQEAGSSSSCSSSGMKFNCQAATSIASPCQNTSSRRQGNTNGGKNPKNLPPLPVKKTQLL